MRNTILSLLVLTGIIFGQAITVKADGSVGIGTTNPSSTYKLSVNGKIRAKEIKVETNWSDYVFEKEYKLLSLESVENFIKKNGHLPDVPKAEVVESEGVDIGQATSLLLRKIEELTLYVIEQDKRIKELESR